MTTRKYAIITAAIGAGVGLILALQVRAGADKVAFPENYAKGIKYLVVDKPSKQVHEFYASPAAIEAARKGEPMPEGTVFTGVLYNAQLGGDGNPLKGPDGRFIKADLRGYAVMEKRNGWGVDYPAEKRNGEWEYRVFAPDKSPNEKANLGACFECHKPMANQDFVHSYDKLKTAESK
jgi:Cytochrome P460